MKALSVCQPFAQLIVSGAKRIETRSWSTVHRGRLAIHASKTLPHGACALIDAGLGSMGQLARGVILGTVDLLDCRPVEELDADLPDAERAVGDFRRGRWAWLLANPVALARPVPYRGRLTLFNVSDELLQDAP